MLLVGIVAVDRMAEDLPTRILGGGHDRSASIGDSEKPQRPRLADPDRAVMDGYLAEMLSLLPVLGVDAFERPETDLPG